MYFLMISFGAAFGYTVMARMSLLIGRFDELVLYATPEYGHATVWLLCLITGGLVWWQRRARQARTQAPPDGVE
jgi:hypothetical protein